VCTDGYEHEKENGKFVARILKSKSTVTDVLMAKNVGSRPMTYANISQAAKQLCSLLALLLTL